MALDLALPRAGLPPQRRAFTHYPWRVAFLALGISALGVWNLASASRSAHGPVWISQLSWMGAGAGCALTIAFIDYRRFMRGAYLFYIVVLLLLVLVLAKGRVVMGARRWLVVGPLNLQPSELAKIAVALALARYFHMDVGRRKDGYGLVALAIPAALTCIPALLILKQPDLGTALIVVAVGATMMLFAKVRWQAIVAIVTVVLAGAVFAYPHLKPYQRKRVETF
ncbi:MAG TPA: FtsW/RodA/SpoVE family cell cycle protein, partial [Anaeromyxobacteraceae bacterium]|nr:FtsW/RodA/SpoVE family cell cycle protein [Anaeromyxobacteraceae bacterium]